MLFNPRFDILLYDLTSTYFEADPPDKGKRKYGYSRDKRPDCVQVVIVHIPVNVTDDSDDGDRLAHRRDAGRVFLS